MSDTFILVLLVIQTLSIVFLLVNLVKSKSVVKSEEIETKKIILENYEITVDNGELSINPTQ
tara:strand:+ start:16561 stop:16746 length:186 start_codon:yes stop_codon:yes gene_type:complete